jgi:hypothetical protein
VEGLHSAADAEDAEKVATVRVYPGLGASSIQVTAGYISPDSEFDVGRSGADRRDSGTAISASLVYADYGDAEIVSAKNPPVIGYSGEYNTNEILFFSLAFNFPLGGVSR